MGSSNSLSTIIADRTRQALKQRKHCNTLGLQKKELAPAESACQCPAHTCMMTLSKKGARTHTFVLVMRNPRKRPAVPIDCYTEETDAEIFMQRDVRKTSGIARSLDHRLAYQRQSRTHVLEV